MGYYRLCGIVSQGKQGALALNEYNVVMTPLSFSYGPQVESRLVAISLRDIEGHLESTRRNLFDPQRRVLYDLSRLATRKFKEGEQISLYSLPTSNVRERNIHFVPFPHHFLTATVNYMGQIDAEEVNGSVSKFKDIPEAHDRFVMGMLKEAKKAKVPA